MHAERRRALNQAEYRQGPIVYWMDRELRAHDNWALLHALELGQRHDQPVAVVYNLVADYLGGGARQYQFKLAALQSLAETFADLRIPFTILLTDTSADDLIAFFKHQKVGTVVTDMNPLRLNRHWKTTVAKALDVPVIEVDAHNIVPVWTTSPKQEFAARTIRSKIHKLLPTFLETFPKLKAQTRTWKHYPAVAWNELEKVKTNEAVKPLTWLQAGEKPAMAMLRSFIRDRLSGYAEKRNDPTLDNLSKLSPYFHYGMLAPQRAALEVRAADAPLADKEAFIEEAVIRRELSDNYCFYNPHYDDVKGFPAWAQQSLQAHEHDTREYVYTKKQFELADTHDELWNAAQREMMETGKMHGYMRMYWAKKILEWTESPAQAQKIAIYLNDKYELDGRDPNGYVGIAWSIGGLHDRPWTSRKVYGQVRYMNANGCRRKFDVEAYIAKWAGQTPLL